MILICSLVFILIRQMNDDKNFYENQVVSKKLKKIDAQDNSKPKNKKQRQKQRREQQQQPQYREYPPNSVTAPREKPNEQQAIFKQLCCILSSHKPKTIRKVLVDSNYNKSSALDQLLSIQPDNQPQEEQWEKIQIVIQKRQSEDNSSTAHSEVANNLMNEVYDNFMKEDINGREFEELFEEIAEMIKMDQKDRGASVIEINNFVDECNIVKQILLVGFREELSNLDDFDFDESYPLLEQTQAFLQEKINKQIKEEKRLEEDYPVIGQAKTNARGQKNIIDRIQQEQKKKKQEAQLFTPSRNMVPQYARQRINEASIFNVDNKLTSERDLMTLHKQFADMPIRDLKFIYKTFVGDFNNCRQFLLRHYQNTRNNKIYEANNSPMRSQPRPIRPKFMIPNLKKEQIDEQLKHLSLKQIRQQLDHLFKLKQALQFTKMKIKSSSQKLELDRMISEKTPLIKRLSQASRVKEVEQMAKKDPHYIDLHGYREEEIDSLFDSITDMVRDEYSKRSEKIKTKKVKGRLTVCLTAVTGKGLHSVGNRSILKPTVVHWAEGKDFDFEQDQALVRIYITVS